MDVIIDHNGVNDDDDEYPLYIEVLLPVNTTDPHMTNIGSARDRTNNVIRDIWLVDSIYKNIFINELETNKDFKNALLIIDYSNDSIIDYCVYNSYMYSDYTLVTDTVSIIKKYNDSLGRTNYTRSINSMRDEWYEHLYLYAVLPEGELSERAKHVDIDSDADGTPMGIFYNLFD